MRAQIQRGGMRIQRRSLVSALALGLVLGTAVWAQGGGADAGPPDVGLDQLLRLPDGYRDARTQRSGATASEWRSRYEKAVADISEAQLALERAQRELEETASDSSQWQMGAPGAGGATTENGPVSFRLREEIRRQRDLLAEARRRFRELEVSADLADVPPEWRLDVPESPPPHKRS